MTKILFICHGNQVREANLQIILDYPAFIEYLALLVLHPLLLSLNEQRKSDQLFYGWSPLVYLLFFSNQHMCHKIIVCLSSSIEYFIKSNFSLLFL